MTLTLLKMDFGSNRVHFGGHSDNYGLEGAMPHLLADTFFSALCHGWLRLYGQDDLEALLAHFLTDHPPWRMSDGFPYFIDHHRAIPLLPKPAFSYATRTHSSDAPELCASIQKKKLKKLQYLMCEDLPVFIREGLNPELLEEYDRLENLWATEIIPQVSVSRTGGDASPFRVNYLRFSEQSGLWVLFDMTDSAYLEKLKPVLEHLGEDVGIGGEKSTGAGRFAPEWPEADNQAARLLGELQSALNFTPDATQLCYLLSLFNPKTEEISIVRDPESHYQIIERRGFHYSMDQGWPGPVKKRPVGMLMAGSLLPTPVQGRLVDVTPALESKEDPPHPLYRYGLALTAGV
jgi:CRISPR-associated protein Csm4